MARILGYTQRERRFNMASLYYWGRQYEDLEEWGASGVPLREKKPSVQVGLTKKAVNKVNAHLFGEGHAPTWKLEVGEDESPDEELEAELQDVATASGLRRRYSELGRLGCLHGTVAIGFYVFEDGRLDTEILSAGTSKPIFGRDNRARAIELGVDFDELLELREYWREYREDETGEVREVWHRRDWTTEETVEYLEILGPIQRPDDLKWQRDEEATVRHDLGFVPAEWITPIEIANDIDGAPVVDEPEFRLEDEINYTLSQTGRGIRYNQEPTLVFVGVDANSDDAIRRGGDNTLRVQSDPAREGGNPDAKLLEMNGGGAVTSMEYVRMVRSLFNEIVQVVDHDPAQFAGALSGVALERLLYPMVLLVQNLRPDYEEKIGRLLSKMLEATGVIADYKELRVSAAWPPVVEATSADLREYVDSIVQLLELDLINRKKALDFLSPFLDVDDVDAFLDEVDQEVEERGTTQTPQALATGQIPNLPGAQQNGGFPE